MSKETIDLLWSIKFLLEEAVEKVARLPQDEAHRGIKLLAGGISLVLANTEQQIHIAKTRADAQKLLFGED